MKPTQAVIAACRQALDWHQEHTDRRSLSEQWMVTFARTVGSNKRPATIMRVNRWFENHEHYRNSDGFFAVSDPTAERIAWEMLGGDAGRSWAAAYVANHNEEDASVADTLTRLDREADDREEWAAATMSLEGYATVEDGQEARLIRASKLANRSGLPVFQQRPLVADEWASMQTFAEFEGRRPEWAGVLTLEEVETSDRRLIRAGALTWRDLPITLQDQLLSQPGHDGAVAAGPITNIYRDGQEIRGEGFFDSGEDGQNARRRMSEGTKQGVSVDLTEVELDLPDDPDELIEILLGDGLLVILAARIGAATLVSIPAFEGARLQIVGDVSQVEPPALVASGGVLPPEVQMRVIVPIDVIEAGFVASGSGDHFEQVQWAPVSVLAEGQYPDESGDELAAHLVIHDEEWVTDLPDEPEVVWTERPVGNGLKMGERGLKEPQDLDTGGVMSLYDRLVSDPGSPGREVQVHTWTGELRPVELTGTEPQAVDIPKGGIRFVSVGPDSDPLVASGGPLGPPPDWFEATEYLQPTPFEISDPDDNGFRQIHGHIALWGSCHIGFSGRCVDVPRGLSYDSFQGPQVPGEVVCSNGAKVKAGPIVMDTVHPQLRLAASDTSAHYADTGSLVAQGCLFEDRHGLQLRGWLMPDVTDAQLARLRAADLSPDWRPRATANGGRGVVAVLAVPVSGFNLGLVASGGPDLDLPDVLVEDLAIVGTNWTPQLSALAARKVAALARLDQPIPEDLARLAAATEAPELTARKEAVMARLSGGGCDCGGSCCSR